MLPDNGLTAAQLTYVQRLLTPSDPIFNPSMAIGYAQFASVGTQTALNGEYAANLAPGIGIPVGSVVGPRFLLSGTPIPLTRNANGQFVAFRPLAQLAPIFPISEDTTFSSIRFDHKLDKANDLSLRFSYNPGKLNGIQDESQNQVLGQNDYSRTGIQTTKDISATMSVASVLPHNLVNDFNLNFGRRHATFDSQVPSVADQIAGSVFTGSNPFSPVDRVEKRWQLRDSMTWATGSHIIKFGGDINWIDVKAEFQLNFPGLFNFGNQSAGNFIKNGAGVACDAGSIPEANRCPAYTPIQTYGLGFPSVFIQGFGDPNSKISNTPIAFFIQDSWKVWKNFTVNYGVRYDVELTDQFAPTAFTDPLTGINLSAGGCSGSTGCTEHNSRVPA